MTVAVLGASPKPERYSHRAIRLLRQHGHEVIPLNPAQSEIEGLPVRPHLDALMPGEADTITVYVNPSVSSGLEEAFLRARPRRVIFNPGAENPDLADRLREAGIEVEEACTLVLLNTGQF